MHMQQHRPACCGCCGCCVAARFAQPPPMIYDPEEDGGGFSFETQSQFDETVQSGYGLDRLELVPCELRHEPDLRAALRGAVALVWCACLRG